MIKSMTGYGRARQELHKRDITVEVRSVNNRYLDCTVKMPRMYAFAEDAVKKHVQQAVSRGKVDVFITVDATAADVVKVAVNRELAAQYAAALGELSDVCGTADYRPAPETLARFPDVLTVTKADEDLEIYTSGTNNILKYPELADKELAGQLITTFEEKQALNQIVQETLADESSTGIQVYIGNETPVKTMKDCSIVTATYELGEGMKGTIGIIGPKRMDYDKVVGILKNLMTQLDTLYKKK